MLKKRTEISIGQVDGIRTLNQRDTMNANRSHSKYTVVTSYLLPEPRYILRFYVLVSKSKYWSCMTGTPGSRKEREVRMPMASSYNISSS